MQVTAAGRLMLIARVHGTEYDLVAVDAATGALVDSFGTHGAAPLGFEADGTHAMVIDEGGRMWITGASYDTGEPRVRVQRRTADGALDPTFGGDGQVDVAMPSGHIDDALALALASDGTLFVASQLDKVLGMRHFLANGTLDTSYGDGGTGVIPVPMMSLVPWTSSYSADGVGIIDMVVQADGKPVVLVYLMGLSLARFDATGQPDPTFGDQGVVPVQWGGDQTIGTQLTIDPDGMLLLGGGFGQSFRETAIARIWP
jgi:uncharacterized delta-60 repeat protein